MLETDNKSFVKIDWIMEKERKKIYEKRYKSPYIITNPKL